MRYKRYTPTGFTISNHAPRRLSINQVRSHILAVAPDNTCFMHTTSRVLAGALFQRYSQGVSILKSLLENHHSATTSAITMSRLVWRFLFRSRWKSVQSKYFVVNFPLENYGSAKTKGL